MASPLVSQPSSGQDVRLYYGASSNNYGATSGINTTADGTRITQTFLIRFEEISTIALNSPVQSVTIDLMNWTAGGAVEMHKMLVSWVTGTANAAAQSGSVCWDYRAYSSVSWGTAGAMGNSDRDSEVSASRTISAYANNTWGSTTKLVADVQSWVDGASNYGWVFYKTSTASGNNYFRSSEYSTASERPKITVTYTDPPAHRHILALFAGGF